jgi:hypothetical protein
MPKHHNSKMEPEVASGAPSTSSGGVPVQGQILSVKSDGEDAETARLAYSYWEARGCTDGSAEEDWVRAEREVKALRL